MKSAFLTVPLTCTQALSSICAGQYISRRKRYGEVIWTGFILLTISTSLTTLFDRNTAIWKCIVILFVQGISQGCIFQPTIISLQAHSPKAQRAIVISIRNFLRCLGGAIGLAVEGAILQNTLKKSLPPKFAYLAKSTYAHPNFSQFSEEDTNTIIDAYDKASHTVFVFLAPLAGVCLLTCIFVKDRGLTRKEDEEKSSVHSATDEEKRDADLESGMPAHNSNLSLADSGKEKDDEKDVPVGITKPATAAVDGRI
jgi:MFS family permease